MKLQPNEKNYGLPFGETIMKHTHYPYRRVKPGGYEYPATYQIVNSDRLKTKRGDIIQFDCCTFKKAVRDEYGVVLERYRIIKQKENGLFKDYYAIVLVTSGKLKGTLYHVSPYRLSGLKKHI